MKYLTVFQTLSNSVYIFITKCCSYLIKTLFNMHSKFVTSYRVHYSLTDSVSQRHMFLNMKKVLVLMAVCTLKILWSPKGGFMIPYQLGTHTIKILAETKA